jgi:hypothetical protein
MKKLLFLFLLLVVTLQSIAQDTYHAVTYTYGVWDSYTQTYDWNDKIAVSIPVTVKGNFVNIYSNVPQTFRILGEGEDLDASTIQWYAIDQDGDHCHVRFSNINGNFYMSISYANLCYFYRLENY